MNLRLISGPWCPSWRVLLGGTDSVVISGAEQKIQALRGLSACMLGDVALVHQLLTQPKNQASL